MLRANPGPEPDEPAHDRRRHQHAGRGNLADLLKYALIVVATVPLLLVYPFVQKHFVKGALIGSLKG